MLIYIAGAGAMGCRFGVQLHRAGEDVILLDNWHEHIVSIQENGLKVNDEVEPVRIPIMKPTEATKTADVIILFTKAMQLRTMFDDIQHVIGDETKVLCLLNGLGHAEVIRDYVKEENIVMGVTVWTAGLNGPGHVLMQGVGTINLQCIVPTNAQAGHVMTDVLNRAALCATYDDNVVEAIWRKACVNGTMNSNCAILDCNIGELFASQDGQQAVDAIIKEFIAVANLENVPLDYDDIRSYVYAIAEKATHHYPSMHQDLVQNRRKTEIDYLNGYIARKAKEYGIQTPYNDYITHLIHTKESTFAK